VRQQKNDAAVETIAQLSTLLRLAIERTGLQEIPFEQELDFIRRYLEIEQIRFGDKLRTEIVVEPDAMAVWVPNIVLQPLVENAIKHGLSRRTSPGLVRLVATKASGRLRVDITNDGPEGGPDADPAAPKRTGIGLSNTRARLDRLYGTDYRLELSTRPEGCTNVQLELPWRPLNAERILP
jgi:sensor histidine kinase YesM